MSGCRSPVCLIHLLSHSFAESQFAWHSVDGCRQARHIKCGLPPMNAEMECRILAIRETPRVCPALGMLGASLLTLMSHQLI